MDSPQLESPILDESTDESCDPQSKNISSSNNVDGSDSPVPYVSEASSSTKESLPPIITLSPLIKPDKNHSAEQKKRIRTYNLFIDSLEFAPPDHRKLWLGVHDIFKTSVLNPQLLPKCREYREFKSNLYVEIEYRKVGYSDPNLDPIIQNLDFQPIGDCGLSVYRFPVTNRKSLLAIFRKLIMCRPRCFRSFSYVSGLGGDPFPNVSIPYISQLRNPKSILHQFYRDWETLVLNGIPFKFPMHFAWDSFFKQYSEHAISNHTIDIEPLNEKFTTIIQSGNSIVGYFCGNRFNKEIPFLDVVQIQNDGNTKVFFAYNKDYIYILNFVTS